MEFELDLTPPERARLQVQADRQGVSVEALISKLVRAHVFLAERTGAKVEFGPGSVDTR